MPDPSDTPVTFARDEVREIRKVLEAEGEPYCPHCGCALVVQSPSERPATPDPFWYVQCNECHRTAFLRE